MRRDIYHLLQRHRLRWPPQLRLDCVVNLILLWFASKIVHCSTGAGYMERSVELSIDEEVPIGTVIGRIDELPQKSVQWRLTCPNNKNDGKCLFAYNAKSGELLTASRLDREALWRPSAEPKASSIGSSPSMDDPSKEVFVDAFLVPIGQETNGSTALGLTVVKIRVKINDINDNAPQFRNPPYQSKKDENNNSIQHLLFMESAAPIGTRLTLPEAWDPDGSGIENYELLTTTDNCSAILKQLRLISRLNRPPLIELLQPLDKELSNKCQLELRATDKGIPPLNSSIFLKIDVVNTNSKNSPEFLELPSSNRSKAMQERKSITDQESLSSHNILMTHVNNTNGSGLKTTAKKTRNDFIGQGNWTLSVKSLPDSSVGFLAVDEHAFNGTPVAVITIANKQGNNNPSGNKEQLSGRFVTLQLKEAENNDQTSNFCLDSGNSFGILRLCRTPLPPPNKMPSHNATVEASEMGSGRKQFLPLTILVRPGEDQAPQPSNPFEAIRLPENLPIGSFVTRIRLNDTERTKRVIFELMDMSITSSGNAFSVDPITGIVYTTRTIFLPTKGESRIHTSDENGLADVDGKRRLELRVRIRNPPPSLKFAVVQLSIEIYDVNNHAPVFENCLYQINTMVSSANLPCMLSMDVPEDQGLNMPVITLKARDGDYGENGLMQFRKIGELLDGLPNLGKGFFRVDPSSGVVSLARPLDFDRGPRLHLVTVVAQDGGKPPRKTVVHIEVNVQERNDNSPTFITDRMEVRVRRGHPVGEPIARAIAKDIDLEDAEPGAISYVLLDGGPVVGAFSIDSVTGLVTPNIPLSGHAIGQRMNLIIGARDSAEHSSTNNLTVSIEMCADDMKSTPFWVKPSAITKERRKQQNLCKTPSINKRNFVLRGHPLFPAENDAHRSDDNENKDDDIVVNLDSLAVGQPLRRFFLWSPPDKEEYDDNNSNIYECSQKTAFFRRNVRYELEGAGREWLSVDSVTGLLWLRSSLEALSKIDQILAILKAYDNSSNATLAERMIRVRIEHGSKYHQRFFNTNLPPTDEITIFLNRTMVETVRPGDLLGSLMPSLKRSESAHFYHNGYIFREPTSFNNGGFLDHQNESSASNNLIRVFPNGNVHLMKWIDKELFLNGTTFDDSREHCAHRDTFIQCNKKVELLNIEKNSSKLITVRVIFSLMKKNTLLMEYQNSTSLMNEQSNVLPLLHQEVSPNSKFYLQEHQGQIFKVLENASVGTVLGKIVIPTEWAQQLQNVGNSSSKHQNSFEVFSKNQIEAEIDDRYIMFRLIPDFFQTLPFAVEPLTGAITVVDQLDRESCDRYRLPVQAIGQPGQWWVGELSVLVAVEDIDDNPPSNITVVEGPSFASLSSSSLENRVVFQVPEDAPIGTIVAQIHYRDADSGANALALFELEEGDEQHMEYFRVGMFSGAVFVNRELDYEDKSAFKLNISLRPYSDAGRTIETAENMNKQFISIEVEVIDVNDNKPMFLNGQPFHLRVSESTNFSFPFPLHTFRAVDRDGPGPNSQITYSIVDADSALFSLDSQSGTLFLKTPLDRETKAEHRLEIRASDWGWPRRLHTDLSVVIEVEDVDDHSPRFRQLVYRFALNESDSLSLTTGNNNTLGILEAIDPDIGINGLYRFVFERPEQCASFRLDPETGALRVVRPVDAERRSRYSCWALVKDIGGLWTDTADRALVEIDILDMNEYAPTLWPNTALDVFFPEDAKPEEILYVVKVVDQDVSDVNLHYGIQHRSLSSDTTYDSSSMELQSTVPFIINSDTGALSAAQKFTKNGELERYTAVIQVEDRRRRHTTLSIQMYPSKREHFPIFSKDSPSELLVWTNSSLDQPLARFQARSFGEEERHAMKNDNSKGIRGKFRYAIAGGDPREHFHIDPFTGDLYRIAEGIEMFPQYKLFISASTVANHQNSAQFTSYDAVNIRTTIGEDSLELIRPRFERNFFRVTVDENSGFHRGLVRLSASSTRQQGQIVYGLRGGNTSESSKFRLDQNTGSLDVLESLDREERDSYRLEVFARNTLIRPENEDYEEVAVIEITVRDDNDNGPRFSRVLRVSVPEDTPVGSLLMVIHATDPDTPENAQNRYTLQDNGEHVFSLDSISGALTLLKPLDRELCEEYRMGVLAEDERWSVRTTLTVRVEDVNDNAPVFERELYDFDLSLGRRYLKDDNSSIKMHHTLLEVGRIKATDPDVEENAGIHYFVSEITVVNNEELISSASPFEKLLFFEAFWIHPKNGTLYVLRSLIQQQNYFFCKLILKTDQNGIVLRLKVNAEDNGPFPHRKSTTTTVHIHLSDFVCAGQKTLGDIDNNLIPNSGIFFPNKLKSGKSPYTVLYLNKNLRPVQKLGRLLLPTTKSCRDSLRTILPLKEENPIIQLDSETQILELKNTIQDNSQLLYALSLTSLTNCNEKSIADVDSKEGGENMFVVIDTFSQSLMETSNNANTRQQHHLTIKVFYHNHHKFLKEEMEKDLTVEKKRGKETIHSRVLLLHIENDNKIRVRCFSSSEGQRSEGADNKDCVLPIEVATYNGDSKMRSKNFIVEVSHENSADSENHPNKMLLNITVETFHLLFPKQRQNEAVQVNFFGTETAAQSLISELQAHLFSSSSMNILLLSHQRQFPSRWDLFGEHNFSLAILDQNRAILPRRETTLIIENFLQNDKKESDDTRRREQIVVSNVAALKIFTSDNDSEQLRMSDENKQVLFKRQKIHISLTPAELLSVNTLWITAASQENNPDRGHEAQQKPSNIGQEEKADEEETTTTGWTFSGDPSSDAYVELFWVKGAQQVTQIEFEFNARRSTGLLLFASIQKSSFLAVDISHGIANVVYRDQQALSYHVELKQKQIVLGSWYSLRIWWSTVTATTMEPPIDNNKFLRKGSVHRINIELSLLSNANNNNHGNGKVSSILNEVDPRKNTREHIDILSDDDKQTYWLLQNITFGGIRNFTQLLSREMSRQLSSFTFAGCIRNMAINGGSPVKSSSTMEVRKQQLSDNDAPLVNVSPSDSDGMIQGVRCASSSSSEEENKVNDEFYGQEHVCALEIAQKTCGNGNGCFPSSDEWLSRNNHIQNLGHQQMLSGHHKVQQTTEQPVSAFTCLCIEDGAYEASACGDTSVTLEHTSSLGLVFQLTPGTLRRLQFQPRQRSHRKTVISRRESMRLLSTALPFDELIPCEEEVQGRVVRDADDGANKYAASSTSGDKNVDFISEQKVQWLELDFRTAQRNATLLRFEFTSKRLTVKIKLKNGTLVYELLQHSWPRSPNEMAPSTDLLLFSAEFPSTSSAYTTWHDRWHRLAIEVTPDGQQLHLQLDGKRTAEFSVLHHQSRNQSQLEHGQEQAQISSDAVPFLFPQILEADLDALKVGGIGDDGNGQDQEETFVGCLRRFIVNNQLQQFIGTVDDGGGTPMATIKNQFLELVHIESNATMAPIKRGCSLESLCRGWSSVSSSSNSTTLFSDSENNLFYLLSSGSTGPPYDDEHCLYAYDSFVWRTRYSLYGLLALLLGTFVVSLVAALLYRRGNRNKTKGAGAESAALQRIRVLSNRLQQQSTTTNTNFGPNVRTVVDELSKNGRYQMAASGSGRRNIGAIINAGGRGGQNNDSIRSQKEQNKYSSSSKRSWSDGRRTDSSIDDNFSSDSARSTASSSSFSRSTNRPGKNENARKRSHHLQFEKEERTTESRGAYRGNRHEYYHVIDEEEPQPDDQQMTTHRKHQSSSEEGTKSRTFNHHHPVAIVEEDHKEDNDDEIYVNKVQNPKNGAQNRHPHVPPVPTAPPYDSYQHHHHQKDGHHQYHPPFPEAAAVSVNIPHQHYPNHHHLNINNNQKEQKQRLHCQSQHQHRRPPPPKLPKHRPRREPPQPFTAAPLIARWPRGDPMTESVLSRVAAVTSDESFLKDDDLLRSPKIFQI